MHFGIHTCLYLFVRLLLVLFTEQGIVLVTTSQWCYEGGTRVLLQSFILICGTMVLRGWLVGVANLSILAYESNEDALEMVLVVWYIV